MQSGLSSHMIGSSSDDNCNKKDANATHAASSTEKVEPTMMKILLKNKKKNTKNKKIKLMTKKKNKNNGKSIEGLVPLSAMLIDHERQKNNLKQN